jgi:serine/threonine-protein kinase
MVASKQPTQSAKVIGRYALHGTIAAGGMATVHLGRLLGPVGFSRTVAIKRLHDHLAGDPEFVQMFIEEARLASRIKHPNVVSTLDVVFSEGQLLLVLDFVLGESLAKLARAAHQAGAPPPVPVLLSIMTGALYGLHAAHEARSERGELLGLVHRDISPQNIMVGQDGVARVLDFGVAKATRKTNQTKQGHLKGKVAYMPPEQVKGGALDRRADVYAASVVLWEALTGLRLFDGDDDFQVANRILTAPVPPPSASRPGLPAALDEAVLRGLSRVPGERFFTAEDMATALENVGPLASPREVGRWVEQVAGASIRERARQITQIESIGMEPSSLSSSPVASEARQVAVSGAPSMLRLAPRPSSASKVELPPVPMPPSIVAPASVVAPPAAPSSGGVPPAPSSGGVPPAPSSVGAPPVPAPSGVGSASNRSFQVPLPPGMAARLSFDARASGPQMPSGLAPVPRPPSLFAAAEAHAEPGRAGEQPSDPGLAPYLSQPSAPPPPVPSGSGPQPVSVGASEPGARPSGEPVSQPGELDSHGVSQVSSISVVRPLAGGDAPERSRRRVVGLVVVMAVLAPLGTVGAWWQWASPTSSTPEVSSQASVSQASVSQASASQASAVVSSAPEASVASSGAPSASPSSSDSPRKPDRKVLSGKPGCNPPYTIDSRGIRRLKPECL